VCVCVCVCMCWELKYVHALQLCDRVNIILEGIKSYFHLKISSFILKSCLVVILF